MKNTLLHFFLLFSFSLAGSVVSAQTTLPYYSGFDNTTEQAGWQQFTKGAAGYFPWSVGGGGFSAPNALSHDYPVGNPGTDTVTDWYVSPPFHFYGGGHLDSLKVKLYSITDTFTAQDHFGIYYLTGSSDPALADTVVLLADLTNWASSSNNWRDTGGFAIPPYNGSTYIAFKYIATNDWFVPNIDNINITGDTANSVTGPTVYADGIKLFPNPSSGTLNLQMPDNKAFIITISDAYGRCVSKQEVHALNTSLDISTLARGTYFVTVFGNSNPIKTLSWVKE